MNLRSIIFICVVVPACTGAQKPPARPVDSPPKANALAPFEYAGLPLGKYCERFSVEGGGTQYICTSEIRTNPPERFVVDKATDPVGFARIENMKAGGVLAVDPVPKRDGTYQWDVIYPKFPINAVRHYADAMDEMIAKGADRIKAAEQGMERIAGRPLVITAFPIMEGVRANMEKSRRAVAEIQAIPKGVAEEEKKERALRALVMVEMNMRSAERRLGRAIQQAELFRENLQALVRAKRRTRKDAEEFEAGLREAREMQEFLENEAKTMRQFIILHAE